MCLMPTVMMMMSETTDAHGGDGPVDWPSAQAPRLGRDCVFRK